MAKNVVPNEQQLNRRGGKDFNRTPNNFFSTNIRQNGENFLDKMRPDEMKNSMQRIFREICRGKIDMSTYASYLAHPQLLNILISESYTTSMEANVIYTCIGNTVTQMNTMGQYADDFTISLQEKYRQKCIAYNLFYSQLCRFRDTLDIMALIILQNNVSACYNYI